MLTVLIFLIVLAVLIFVHELGHFLFAKIFGIRVDAFKIGFGPKIFAWTPKKKDGSKGETEYGLNLIPFGGYVKIFGENPDAESILGVDHKRSMVHKKKWQQIIVLIGGVTFNFIFAAILYIGLFSHGVTATADGFPKYTQYFSNERIMVTDVMPGSPADKAGLKVGDVIWRVSLESQTKVQEVPYIGNVVPPAQTIEDIQKFIRDSNGAPLIVDYIDVTNGIRTPSAGLSAVKNSSSSSSYLIGIAMSDVADMKLPFFTALYEGAHYTVDSFGQTVVGLYAFVTQIFHGKADFSQVTGPVGIAGIVGDAARLGFTYLLMITALISINLAVINLIPFPALDGGRVLFIIIEAVIRRPIPPKYANGVNIVGFGLLMLLMVVITYKDIVKLFK